MLCAEVCQQLTIFTFATYVEKQATVSGFGLYDAIKRAPTGGTDTRAAVEQAKKLKPDRIIVITDEQSHTLVPEPGCKGYIMNVASYQHGIGYGPWVTITGFSEQLIRFITEYEKANG
jgi:60 kDa SS-A/Ro ribonucleoprotein